MLSIECDNPVKSKMDVPWMLVPYHITYSIHHTLKITITGLRNLRCDFDFTTESDAGRCCLHPFWLSYTRDIQSPGVAWCHESNNQVEHDISIARTRASSIVQQTTKQQGSQQRCVQFPLFLLHSISPDIEARFNFYRAYSLAPETSTKRFSASWKSMTFQIALRYLM